MKNTDKKVLILGAGGAGVSNIAQIYFEQGYNVVGVDKLTNSATENLESKGIKVYKQEDFKLTNDYDFIFRSAAIKEDNPIVVEARKLDIKVISRYEFFSDISGKKDVIAIAGSSGKTSTTGIVSYVLKGDKDCGYLVGIHGNGGHYGGAKDFVLEADEYAKTFLHLSKVKIGIITGLKYDHVDIYPTKQDYDKAFIEFATKCKLLIINGDDTYLKDTMKDFKPITFGYDIINDWTARNVVNFEGGSSFDVYNKEDKVDSIILNVIGGHNIINALAGFVANFYNDVPTSTIVRRLKSFKGLPRRVEKLRETPFIVYDDYAHLPFEINTVLKGLRESYKNRRIICYFQGHTYTRINAFFDDYSKALSNCDILLLGDVYAARDAEGSVDLNKLISLTDVKEKYLSGNIETSIAKIKTLLKDNDVLICLNAGDGTKIAHYFKNYNQD
jgi:UDP-N-acetylmuramate--alanine ligase